MKTSVRLAPLLLALAVAAAGRAQDSGAPAPAADSAVRPTDPADANLPALGLEECVARALAQNFNVRIQAFPMDQAKAGVVIAQSAYDPTLGVTWQKTVDSSPTVTTTIPGTSISVVEPGSSYNDQNTTLSVAQPVVTGGTVSANYALGRDQESLGGLLNPAYVGNVSLSVSQPLLQGAGIDYGRANIRIAQLGVAIAKENVKSAVLSVIDNVETAYNNLIFARQQYDVGCDNLRLAKDLYDQNVGKRRAGVMTDLDVLQAETQVATAQSQLIGFRQTVQNNEDLLLQALGETQFRSGVGPVAFPPLPDTNVSFDLSYKLARDNGPSLPIVEATMEQFKLDALKAKRNNLPALSVNGAVGYASEQDSYSDAQSRLVTPSGRNWQAGLTLSVPWGMRANQAQYRQAMDNYKSEQIAMDQTDQTLVVNVRSAVRAVQAGVASLEAATKTAVLAQKQYELELAELKVGLVTSYDVLLTQQQLETSRVSELEARAGLYNALANLRMLEGTSLDRYRVNLK